MALAFHSVQSTSIRDLTAEIPDAAIIGIIGEKASGASELARLAARLDQPLSGEIVSNGSHLYLGPLDTLQLAPVELLILDHTFAQADALVRARAAVALNRLRANGSVILLFSNEPALVRELCDEVWWLEEGRIAGRGDPQTVLASYRARIADKVQAWGATLSEPLAPAMRKGDGRAEIIALETLGESGKPTGTWRSGEPVTVRVTVRFRQEVEGPVIGIMLRTRIGLEVYGTNTELEKLPLGAIGAGETVTILFQFACDLCPKEYTLTAASHDPDGTAHDWMDDAAAVLVTDTRSTAGVANLRAKVERAGDVPDVDNSVTSSVQSVS